MCENVYVFLHLLLLPPLHCHRSYPFFSFYIFICDIKTPLYFDYTLHLNWFVCNSHSFIYSSIEYTKFAHFSFQLSSLLEYFSYIDSYCYCCCCFVLPYKFKQLFYDILSDYSFFSIWNTLWTNDTVNKYNIEWTCIYVRLCWNRETSPSFQCPFVFMITHKHVEKCRNMYSKIKIKCVKIPIENFYLNFVFIKLYWILFNLV